MIYSLTGLFPKNLLDHGLCFFSHLRFEFLGRKTLVFRAFPQAFLGCFSVVEDRWLSVDCFHFQFHRFYYNPLPQ